MSLEYRRQQSLELFRRTKRDFLRELSGTFRGFILSGGRSDGYSDHILNVFLRFNFKSNFDLDFEFDFSDFLIFDILNLSREEWMSIYGLFVDVFKYDNKLNPFIYLFFYDLIYHGPFSEDIEALDMSDELLGLMGNEMLTLYNLFDEYFQTGDSRLVAKIADAAGRDSIPSFVVINLAHWMNEHVGNNKEELGDHIIELYVAAIEKIYKKPILFDDDLLEVSSIRFAVDSSNFTDSQIEKFYSNFL